MKNRTYTLTYGEDLGDDPDFTLPWDPSYTFKTRAEVVEHLHNFAKANGGTLICGPNHENAVIVFRDVDRELRVFYTRVTMN